MYIWASWAGRERSRRRRAAARRARGARFERFRDECKTRTVRARAVVARLFHRPTSALDRAIKRSRRGGSGPRGRWTNSWVWTLRAAAARVFARVGLRVVGVPDFRGSAAAPPPVPERSRAIPASREPSALASGSRHGVLVRHGRTAHILPRRQPPLVSTAEPVARDVQAPLAVRAVPANVSPEARAVRSLSCPPFCPRMVSLVIMLRR